MTEGGADMSSPVADRIQDPAPRLEHVFAGIHRERMHGLPILNPRLSVAVVGGRVWGDDWIGVLVTPWTMSLVAMPLAAAGPEPAAGGTCTLELPAGHFPCVLSAEPGVGYFAACPLFSPMGEFPDQDTALATARAILDALFVPEECAGAGSKDPGRGISRRGLLRGALGRS